MRQNKRCSPVFFALAGLSLAALLVGCGGAKADPLEVTYYYLPG